MIIRAVKSIALSHLAPPATTVLIRLFQLLVGSRQMLWRPVKMTQLVLECRNSLVTIICARLKPACPIQTMWRTYGCGKRTAAKAAWARAAVTDRPGRQRTPSEGRALQLYVGTGHMWDGGSSPLPWMCSLPAVCSLVIPCAKLKNSSQYHLSTKVKSCGCSRVQSRNTHTAN